MHKDGFSQMWAGNREPIAPVMKARKVRHAAGRWGAPIRADKFVVTQAFFNPDPLYKITGHHPGTDYGTRGEDDVPLYFCADGEVIESGSNDIFGNYFFYYVRAARHTGG